MHPDVPQLYLILLLCLTLGNLTCQEESAATHWVNQTISAHASWESFKWQCTLRSILLCPMPDDFTCQGESAVTELVKVIISASVVLKYKR
jgi:phage-related protein